ncbi:MAG: peptidylprolyl isomerase [Treponema sp.]|nr:peptidylprolyl isomerase [Treponema sp.]
MKKLFKIGAFVIAAMIMTTSLLGCSSKKKEEKKLEIEALNGKEGVFAVLTTEKGQIILNLFYKETPLTVSNFVGLAEGTLDAAKGKPFYDGLTFHRVIADFMIQGGDPLGNGTGGPGYKFADEFVDELIFDKPGKLAMANSGANTNGSQFFITHVPTDWLNYKHTIFGEVVSGQDVVDAVEQEDHIISLQIVRQGKEAEAFTVTQKSFDKLKAEGEKNALKFYQEKAEREKKRAEEQLKEITKDCEKSKEGVFYKIKENGTGEKVGKGKVVTVEYIGYLTDGTAFDASSGFHPQGHEPLSFTSGAGQMIPGFDYMVQDMTLGETRTIIIPPALAYGDRGINGVIPGGAYICFDVKVIKF